MQQANWEAIRTVRDQLNALYRAEMHVQDVASVGNTVVVLFEDESEVTWTPMISKRTSATV